MTGVQTCALPISRVPHRYAYQGKIAPPLPAEHQLTPTERRPTTAAQLPKHKKKTPQHKHNNKKKHSQNPKLHAHAPPLKQLEKEEQKTPKASRRKEIIKIRSEINEKEMKETIAKKRNEIELFGVKWMGLESVIQSEVRQKEKNKYRMLTHIHGTLKKKMVLKKLGEIGRASCRERVSSPV